MIVLETYRELPDLRDNCARCRVEKNEVSRHARSQKFVMTLKNFCFVNRTSEG
jgi:hypothetical protein